MAYPPPMQGVRTDASPATPGSHAADHTTLDTAIQSILDELGADPSGASADVTTRLGTLLVADDSYASAATIVAKTRVVGDANPRWELSADGTLSWGPGGGLASDISLYRSGILTLDTSGYFRALLGVTVAPGTSQQVNVGPAGPGSEAGIRLGSAGDTNLYRSAADVLRTSDNLVVDLDMAGGQTIKARNGQATQVAIGSVGPSSQSGISFQNGEAGSNLYRASASALKTDAQFTVSDGVAPIVYTYLDGLRLAGTDAANTLFNVGSDIGITAQGDIYLTPQLGGAQTKFFGAGEVAVRNGLAAQVKLGAVGPSSEAGALFGSAGDTNLYRSAADTLKTDDTLQSALNVFADVGTAAQVMIGAAGPSSEAGVLFGSGGDTNLYRVAAGVIRTDGAVEGVQYISAKRGTTDQVTLGLPSASGVMLCSGTAAGAAAPGSAVLSFGTGAPNNASGSNGHIYLRTDGGAGTTIYQRRAGAWVGIV